MAPPCLILTICTYGNRGLDFFPSTIDVREYGCIRVAYSTTLVLAFSTFCGRTTFPVLQQVKVVVRHQSMACCCRTCCEEDGDSVRRGMAILAMNSAQPEADDEKSVIQYQTKLASVIKS